MTPHHPVNRLTDGLDDAERAELGALESVAEQLSAWQAPEPTAAEQAALLARLKLELPDLAAPAPRQTGARAWLGLLAAQIQLFEPEFWYACAALLFCTLAGGLLGGAGALSVLTLLVSPLVAAGGVLYAFRSESASLQDLEAASRVGPRALFFCRSGLILAMNLAALPLLLLPGQLLLPELSFWRVVVVWLGLLVGLYGLAVYTSVRWNGRMGVLLPLTVWGLLVLVGWQQSQRFAPGNQVTFAWLAGVVSSSNALLIGMLVSAALGLLLYGLAARSFRGVETQWA
jgi:hypothetical protein